jgi:hypothetical protein
MLKNTHLEHFRVEFQQILLATFHFTYWHGVLVLLCSYSVENRGSVLKNFAIVTNEKKVFIYMFAVLCMPRLTALSC